MRNTIAALIALTAAGPALAQDWDYTATLYGWLPNRPLVSFDTPYGEISWQPSDAPGYGSTDMWGIMGKFTAQRGKLSFILDTSYMSLTDTYSTPGLIGVDSASVGGTLSITNGYAMWEVLRRGGNRIDAGAGLRYYDISAEIALDTASGPYALTDSDGFLNGVVALRYRGDFGNHLYGVVFADYGGVFDESTDYTWQGVAAIGYRFTDSFSIEGGYRYLTVVRSNDVFTTDVDLAGPVLGVTWSF